MRVLLTQIPLCYDLETNTVHAYVSVFECYVLSVDSETTVFNVNALHRSIHRYEYDIIFSF